MTVRFEKEIGGQLANLCQWVYSALVSGPAAGADAQTHQRQLAPWLTFRGETPTVKTFQGPSKVGSPPTSYAATFFYDEFVAVAFQGTISEFKRDQHFSIESLLDWLQNLRFVTVHPDVTDWRGQVHKGFFDEVQAVLPAILTELRSHLARPENRGKRVYVTGHSQGGAEAALATRWLELSGIRPTAAYTFAAPRSGDREFSASVASPIFRFEFGRDIVPHLPPTLPELVRLTEKDGVLGKLAGLTGGAVDALRSAVNRLFDFGDDSPANRQDRSNRTPLGVFLELSQKAQQDNYAGVGQLYYQTAEDQPVRIAQSAGDEDTLYRERFRQLFHGDLRQWVDHHHMIARPDGTGGYAGLVQAV